MSTPTSVTDGGPAAWHARLRARSSDWRKGSLAVQGKAPSRRELAGVTAVLALFAGALYVPYAFRGGWYTDDWSWISEFHFHHRTLATTLDHLLHVPGYRELLPPTWWLQSTLGGIDRPAHLIQGSFIVVLECALFYAVLRRLSLRALPAASASILLLVLPWVDATRLWPTVFSEALAVCLYLTGVIVALRGLRARHSAQVPWHAAAAVLYAAACLLYEGLIPLVFASPALYAVVAGLRAALRRWPADAGVALITLGLIAEGARTRGSELNVGHFVDRARELAHGWLEVLSFTVPGDRVLVGWLGLVLALLAAVGVGLALERGGETAHAIRRWGVTAALGLAFALLGLVMLVPATSLYTPAWRGTDDRLFVVAALGSVVLIVALAWLGALGFAALARRPGTATPLAVLALTLTIVPLALQELRNQDAWVRASDQQERIVRLAQHALGPDPAPGSAVATFRHENFTHEHVPVFATSWDLQGALRLRYDDPTLMGHPLELPISCGEREVAFPDHGGPPPPARSDTLHYGRLWFVDASNGSATRVRGRAQCEQAVAALGGG